MENNGAEIQALMASSGNSAAEMTHALKEIGDGSMERGLKFLEEFSKEDKAISMANGVAIGLLLGSGVTTGIFLIVRHIKKKRARHEEKRKKIYEALESSDSIPIQEPDTDEISD